MMESFLYKLGRVVRFLLGHREISSIDFIKKLKFDYAEIYSFNRGEGYEEEDPHYEYILNSKKLHPSAVKTQTFKSTHENMKALKRILQTEALEVPYFMCAPVYRDAIVFYNKHHKIVSTLNVCLSCGHMAVNGKIVIHADEQTYALINRFFKDCGHAIKDCFMDDEGYLAYIKERDQKS